MEPKIRLYLDNDPTGNEDTHLALKVSQKFKDERQIYKGHKDLNEWLMSSGHIQKQKVKIRR